MERILSVRSFINSLMDKNFVEIIRKHLKIDKSENFTLVRYPSVVGGSIAQPFERHLMIDKISLFAHASKIKCSK